MIRTVSTILLGFVLISGCGGESGPAPVDMPTVNLTAGIVKDPEQFAVLIGRRVTATGLFSSFSLGDGIYTGSSTNDAESFLYFYIKQQGGRLPEYPGGTKPSDETRLSVSGVLSVYEWTSGKKDIYVSDPVITLLPPVVNQSEPEADTTE